MVTIILWLCLSAAFFGVGEYYSKKWAIDPSWTKAFTLISMYVMGTIAWLPAIYKGQTLSVVGTIWNLLSLCITLFIGMYIFKESITTQQIIGICFAFVAIILLST